MRRLTTLALLAGLVATGCSGSDDLAESTTTVTAAPPVDTTVPVGTDTDVSSVVAETTLAPTPQSGDATTTTAAPSTSPTSTTPTTSTSPDLITEDDIIRFIAATEVPLEGTSLEGVVFNDPEIYIAIAQVSCARFSAGDTFDQIAADLLDELASDNTDDDERLVGAILGAATRTICPEHADNV